MKDLKKKIELENKIMIRMNTLKEIIDELDEKITKLEKEITDLYKEYIDKYGEKSANRFFKHFFGAEILDEFKKIKGD